MSARKYMIAGEPPKMPTSDKEWDAARTTHRKQSVNDIAELGIRALAKEKNGAFTDLLNRRNNAESVTGLTVTDQATAAGMLVERTAKMGFPTFQGDKGLGLAYKAINSVMSHRYKMSRMQLRKESLVSIEHVGEGSTTADTTDSNESTAAD